MTALAGYVVEEMLGVADRFDPDTWDNAAVIFLLRQLMPRRPKDGWAALERWRSATRELLRQPETLREITAAADLLLELEVVDGQTFYGRLYGGKCSAVHPERPHVRCTKAPHRFGSHWTSESDDHNDLTFWDGLSLPDRRQRVGAMSTRQKNIRAVNLGQPPDPLPQSWLRTLRQLEL